jgi:hypothetical protein
MSMGLLLVALVFLGSGCSTDPTTTDEYRDLEEKMIEVEAQLEDATADVEALRVELDAAATSGEEASQDGLTPEQQQMLATIDLYIAAWNEGDAAAADALMDPNGYLEDVGGRWFAADGGYGRYLESLHALGFPIERSQDVDVVGSVVLTTNTYAEGSTAPSPNIYYMYPDGTKIWWVLEPYPLALP